MGGLALGIETKDLVGLVSLHLAGRRAKVLLGHVGTGLSVSIESLGRGHVSLLEVDATAQRSAFAVRDIDLVLGVPAMH